MLGRNAAFLFGEDGEQVLEAMNRRLLAGEEGFENHSPRRSKSGAPVDVAVSVSPLKDVAGRLVGVTAIARDVSALARAHRALQQSDRRLSLALSIARVETWEVDLSSGAIRSSEGLGPIFGRARGFQFENRLAWREAIHPRDRQRVTELFDAAASGQADYDVEYAVLRPDGSEGWVTSRCVFERDESGRAIRAVGMLMDLTERHRFEQQLHAEKELAQVTLRSIGDAVITTDANGRVTYLNPTAEQLTGWALEEAQGASYLGSVPHRAGNRAHAPHPTR